MRLGGLASLAADFMGSAKFQDVPFELPLGLLKSSSTAFQQLRKRTGCEVDVIPKVWIPARSPMWISSSAEVNSPKVLEKLNADATELCQELRELPERLFRQRMQHVYPELAYFRDSLGLREQSVCGGPLTSTWNVCVNTCV